MKRFFLLIISSLLILIIASCKNTNNTSKDGKIVKSKDSVYEYYPNGNLKSKGKLSLSKHKMGWWFYYDSLGNIDNKIEHKYIDDKLYQNQIISYREDGSIDYNNSSFFEIEIKDTLEVGKNIGKIKSYYSDFSGDDHLLSVIVNNKYNNGIVKKDTFSDGTLKPRFGIFAPKKGKQKVSLIILEEVLNEVKASKDSSVLNILKHKKYFEKEVYVRDTIN